MMKSLETILEEVVRSQFTKETLQSKVKEIVERVVLEACSEELGLPTKPSGATIENTKPNSTYNIDINQIRLIAKKLNKNLRKRLSDQRYRHNKTGDYHISAEENFDYILDMLLTSEGYKLIRGWEKSGFNPSSEDRVLVELVKPEKGISRENLRLCKKSKAKTFHHQVFKKLNTNPKKDKQSWIKYHLDSSIASPIYYNPNSGQWIVTIRHGNKFFKKKHFSSKELAQQYAQNFKNDEVKVPL